MEMVIALLVKLLGVFGGATVLENMLENYVMDHVPQWAKGLVVPVLTLGFAAVTSLHGGTPIGDALKSAVEVWAATTFLHNVPATTSAEIIGPPPALPDSSN